MAGPFRKVEHPAADLVQPLEQVLRAPRQLRETDRIRVAQYNVYNLFGQYHDKPKPVEQLRALAHVILDLDADVISFAEVQAEAVLRAFFQKHVNSELPADTKYDAFICLPANDRRGINVALVTRLSVRGAMTFHDREFDVEGAEALKFSRDLLGVKIQMTPNPQHTYLHFASHLKSKIGGAAAEEKRGLEASEIVSILSEETFGPTPFMEQDCLLCGDMNDDPDTRAIEILRAEGRLVDEFASVDPNATYPTRINEGPGRRRYPPTRLDYIFTSPSMSPRLSEPTIHRDAPADEASDHYPLSAVMRVG